MTTLSIQTIQQALAEIIQPFSDPRIHHCQIAATGQDASVCTLSGSVLDAETLTAVLDALAARFPDVTFETKGIRILRQPHARWLTVNTNVTSVNARPDLTAERMTQVMGGWRVELLQEEDGWAYIRQQDGYLGWVYRGHLKDTPAPDPTHLLCAPVSLLHASADASSPVTGRMTAGELTTPLERADGWARVAGGWLPASHLRPLDAPPAEPETRRRQMVVDALQFLGVPYLWGGCTGFGIDCSGFVRRLYQLSGLALPRDADMQFRAGRAVYPPFRPGDLLFFGNEGSARAITHVGMSLGGWRMIHSSLSRNGVYIDDVQQTPHLRQSFVAARAFIP